MLDPNLLAAAASLNQSEIIWLFSLRRAPAWVEDDYGEPLRPYLSIVVEHESGVVRSYDLTPAKPEIDELLRVLMQAMLFPASGSGNACRPSEIRCDNEALVIELRAALAPLAIAVNTYLNLPAVDVCLRDMANNFNPDAAQLPTLVDIQGLEMSQLASFYLAAASYYQKTPWRRVADDQTIAVHYPSSAEPVYAIILGNAGEVEGLALYRSLKPLSYALAGLPPIPLGTEQDSVLSLTYSEEQDLHFAELDALEFHQWPIAGPEAYPQVMKLQDIEELELLTLAELQLLTAALTALPDFVAKHMKRRPKKTVSETIALEDGQEIKLVTPVEVPMPDPGALMQSLTSMLSQLDPSELPFDPDDLLSFPFLDDEMGYEAEAEAFSRGWLPEKMKNKRRYENKFVMPLALDLYECLDWLGWQGYATSTMEKHEKNAWAIGWLLCKYRLANRYDQAIFAGPPQLIEEFKEHFSSAKSRVASYEATWNKVGEFIALNYD